MRLKKSLLHLYNFQKQYGEVNPLNSFLHEVNPVALSTCMRHIYIFNSSPEIKVNAAIETLSNALNQPRSYQGKVNYLFLHDIDAYAFLLFWAIGALNKNKPLKDSRILGNIRDTCLEYEQSKSDKKKKAYEENKKYIIYFLADAKHMHKTLVDYSKLHFLEDKTLEEKQEVIDLFKQACYRCAKAREKGILDQLPNFNYKNFLTNDEELNNIFLANLQETELNLEAKLLKINNRLIQQSFKFSTSPQELSKAQEEIAQTIQSIQALRNEIEGDLEKEADKLAYNKIL